MGLFSRSVGTSGNQKPPVGRFPSLSLNGPAEFHPKHAGDVNSSGTDRKEIAEKRPLSFPNTALLMQAVKPNDSRPHSTTSSSSSVVGLYSSSSDPVHVPSPDSRPATNVGIEVGIVGVCRQPSENPVNLSSARTSSSLNSNLGRDGTSKESFRYFNAISESDQPSQTAVSESAFSSMSVSRSFLNNHYSNRPHQQPVGPQKVPNKLELALIFQMLMELIVVISPSLIDFVFHISWLFVFGYMEARRPRI
ncbi:unnamed protein product [Ilex paraguariensis]|uniref:Uncharacterized protein n=1 Tax=Ilex paraguariensis TaxID=185542 RepID=A0ABC8UFW0_9AQUA